MFWFLIAFDNCVDIAFVLGERKTERGRKEKSEREIERECMCEREREGRENYLIKHKILFPQAIQFVHCTA